ALDAELEGALRADSAFARFDDKASYVVRFRTYDIGPSYAIELKQDWGAVRIGASAFLAYSTFTNALATETLGATIPPTDSAQIQQSRFSSGSSFDFAPIVGAQLDLDIFSIGVSFHAPSLHIGGSYENRARLTGLANGIFNNAMRPSPETLVATHETGGYEER